MWLNSDCLHLPIKKQNLFCIFNDTFFKNTFLRILVHVFGFREATSVFNVQMNTIITKEKKSITGAGITKQEVPVLVLMVRSLTVVFCLVLAAGDCFTTGLGVLASIVLR